MIKKCPSCGVPLDINVKLTLKVATTTREERFPPNWRVTEFANMTFDYVWSIDADYMMDVVHQLDGVLKEALVDYIKRKQG